MPNVVFEPEAFQRLAQQTAESLGLGDDYEPGPLACFGRALTRADRFLDVGANRGLYACLANRVLRNSEIALVEANPELAERLRQDITQWPTENGNKITVYPVAAGDVPTKLPFFMDETDTLGSFVLDPDQTDASKYLDLSKRRKVRRIDVACEPLDKLFQPADRTLIKIDVEGFEYRVLQGAKKLLSASDTRLLIELHGWGDAERRKYPLNVMWFMHRLGFTVHRMGHSYSYDFKPAGFFGRCMSLLRSGPTFVIKHIMDRTGLRPFVYRILRPALAANAER
jgi:FkbM family methyltransferase